MWLFLTTLAEVGFCGGETDALTYTLDAVNLAIARMGDRMAWRQVPRDGTFVFVPGYLWLDTGEPPAM